MASSDQRGRYVQLRNGPVLPVESILLALHLEKRGFTLTREGDDTLSVQPYQRLTTEDCIGIRRWKWHLLSIVDYVPEVLQ